MYCSAWTGFVFRYPSYHHLTYLKWTILTTAKPKKQLVCDIFSIYFVVDGAWFATEIPRESPNLIATDDLWGEINTHDVPFDSLRPLSEELLLLCASLRWAPRCPDSPSLHRLFCHCCPDGLASYQEGLAPDIIHRVRHVRGHHFRLASRYYLLLLHQPISAWPEIRMGAGASNWEKVYSHPPEKQIAPW